MAAEPYRSLLRLRILVSRIGGNQFHLLMHGIIADSDMLIENISSHWRHAGPYRPSTPIAMNTMLEDPGGPMYYGADAAEGQRLAGTHVGSKERSRRTSRCNQSTKKRSLSTSRSRRSTGSP